MSRSTPDHLPAEGDRPHRDASSRGSVLIFVVGVLLLLAIVATAFLGATRSDRTATQQNSFNTQVDLLLDGVVNAAKGQIINDETVPGNTTVEPWDAYTYATPLGGTQAASNDDWLAARVPTTADRNAVYNGTAVWPVISTWMLNGQFESPYRASAAAVVQYSDRQHMKPTYVTFAGQNWPALQPLEAAGVTPTYLAADADGDGVADSGLFRIPVGQLAGITYYGAVRIIDNNAAVNINTALSRDYDFLGNGAGGLVISNGATGEFAPGAFTSNIGLAEMLHTTIASGSNTSLPLGPTTPTNAMEKMTDSTAPSTGREFELLNHYRFNLSNTTVRPSGVYGITTSDSAPYDDTPSAGTPAAGTADQNGNVSKRTDFQYASVGEAMTDFLGVRPTDPGVSRYTGTLLTALTPNYAHGSIVDGINLAARFSLGGLGDAYTTSTPATPGSLTQAIGYSLTYNSSPPTPRTQPYDGLSSTSGIDTWFRSNFDYLAEYPSSPLTTFMNRRTILTGINGASNVVAAGVVAVPVNLSSTAIITPAPMSLPPAITGVPSGIDAKISINTGRFEELFYGFFQTLARSDFTGNGDDAGTPYTALRSKCLIAREKTLYNGTTPTFQYSGDSDGTNEFVYYDDPYIGMRFTPTIGVTPTFPDRIEPNIEAYDVTNNKTTTASTSLINGLGGVAEQNPLRQFRSALRAPHDRSTTFAPTQTVAAYDPTRPTVTTQLGYWNDYTARLPADQVLILRAAIAAANVEALRDSSHSPDTVTMTNATNERVVMHQIPLKAKINNVVVPVIANVFGLRRQPFITEIYANTNSGADTAPGAPNIYGYFAIKLFNPNPYAISLRYCRLVGLRRFMDKANAMIGSPASTATRPPYTIEQYPNMAVRDLAALSADPTTGATDQIDLGTAQTNLTGTPTYAAYVIPPYGVLILENYRANVAGPAALADDAQHRPQSTNLGTPANPSVPISPANANTVNFAYVRGLQRVCLDRELVLMRPTNATPPTGIIPPNNVVTYLPAGGTAAVSNSISGMVPLDSYDFTGLNTPDALVGPVPGRAEIWSYKRPVDLTGAINRWKWVYPGRYDGNQSIVNALLPGTQAGPRQQGTVRAIGADAAAGFPPTDPIRDPFVPSPPPQKVTLNVDPITPAAATYPDTFTIPLNCDGYPGDRQLHSPAASANLFPFGGFRHLADVLEAPFIGSYTITDPAAVGPANSTSFLEVNSVTADATLAEDTDPADNEHDPTNAPADTGRQSREQIGRFMPLRPSYGSAAGFVHTNGGGAVAQNGDPADLARGPNAADSYSVDFDGAFNTSINSGQNTDPLRYRDDVADNDAAPLPIDTTLAPLTKNNQYVRANRYQFANTLFDHFAIVAPHDDYLPNYPTQPKWQPNTAYAVGDTVQFGMNTYVCTTAITSGNDTTGNAEINRGVAAIGSNKLLPPVATNNWTPLQRTPVTNASATAGSRSDLTSATARSTDFYTTDDGNEVTQSRAGLININTAPERVLAAIPWAPRQSLTANGDYLSVNFKPNGANPPLVTVTYGPDGIDDNAQIAHMIALYRDGNYLYDTAAPTANGLNISTNPGLTYGHALTPFASLYDLLKVPGFLDVQNAILQNGEPVAKDGVYSQTFLVSGAGGAAASQSDFVRYDFEEQTLLLNRVSNLITTKSDVFTLYALVQGWRNVGTANPELVVQRRAAFIVDRSAVTKAAASGSLTSTRVPVN